jgi:hypothetical protein
VAGHVFRRTSLLAVLGVALGVIVVGALPSAASAAGTCVVAGFAPTSDPTAAELRTALREPRSQRGGRRARAGAGQPVHGRHGGLEADQRRPQGRPLPSYVSNPIARLARWTVSAVRAEARSAPSARTPRR